MIITVIFFVNDMSSYIQPVSLDYLSIDELQIHSVLFANDTVLFSYIKLDLQILLNKWHTICFGFFIYFNILVHKTITIIHIHTVHAMHLLHVLYRH